MSESAPFEVVFAQTALDDLDRLFDFRLDAAKNLEDLVFAQGAIDAIDGACRVQLALNPFNYRKTGTDPLRRELIIGFGTSGYVAAFEIEPQRRRVVVLAVRHQLEDDYH